MTSRPARSLATAPAAEGATYDARLLSRDAVGGGGDGGGVCGGCGGGSPALVSGGGGTTDGAGGGWGSLGEVSTDSAPIPKRSAKSCLLGASRRRAPARVESGLHRRKSRDGGGGGCGGGDGGGGCRGARGSGAAAGASVNYGGSFMKHVFNHVRNVALDATRVPQMPFAMLASTSTLQRSSESG